MTLTNLNSRQETGSSKPLASLTMAVVSKKHDHVHAGGSDYSFRTAAASLLLLLFTILWAGESAKAQDQADVPPRPASQQTTISRQTTISKQTTSKQTTMVIFADRRMEDRQWNALFDALRRDLAGPAAETRGMADHFQIVRGDTMQPGMDVESPIVVYLHGDCNLAPQPRRTAFGVPLGWVWLVDGRIAPFAHVDCTRIGQVLGPQALGMGADRRNGVMAGAIARVILHEWIHIATQNPGHAERGITKAQFGVADLMMGGE
jgi:hypothetical protein